MEKKYIRTERPNLFEPNDYISMVVELDVRVWEEKIHKKLSDIGNELIEQTECARSEIEMCIYDAVAETYRSHEATMSQIILEQNGSAYYLMQEVSGCKIFFDQRDWHEILVDSEKRPFELWNGELIRTYINVSDGKATIFIMAHHLVGDGKAILIFIHDVLRILSGENVSFQPMKLVDEAELRKKTHFPMALRIWIQKMNRMWKKKGKIFTREDYLEIHRKYWATHRSKIKIEEFDKNELARMKAECPKGVTLNSYLITMLAKEHPECNEVGIPVSIREQNMSMTNQTSGIQIQYQYQKNKSFEKNLFMVHKKVQKCLNKSWMKYFILPYMANFEPSLIDAVLMESHGCYYNPVSEKLAKTMGYLGEKKSNLGVTNLMVLDIPAEYRAFKVENIYFVPPKVSYTKNVVGVATFDGKLSIIEHLTD